MNSDDMRRARVRQDEATSAITGNDPRKSSGEDARAAQRLQLATFHRQCYDAGFDPLLMIETMLAGAAFFADNHGVSREQLSKVILELSHNRSLIVLLR